MNIDLNNFDDRTFKNIEFSVLPVGGMFFSRRPRLNHSGQDDTEPFYKMVSIRNARGNWVNAKTKMGYEAFIPYDKKVLIVEST